MTALVRCENLIAGYGTTVVVRDLSLYVNAGEVVALLGPNGAGKTTTLMTLVGLLPKIGGTCEVLGHNVNPSAPHKLARHGMSHVPDDRALFASLSVRDNLRLARTRTGYTIDEVLDFFPTLTKRVRLRAGALSGGEQQMLAIARGMISRPRLLVIDEMTMGLAPVIVSGLLPVMRHVADATGAGVLMVEQHVNLALTVADRAYVLVHGELHLESDAATLRERPQLLEDAYLGRGTAAEVIIS